MSESDCVNIVNETAVNDLANKASGIRINNEDRGDEQENDAEDHPSDSIRFHVASDSMQNMPIELKRRVKALKKLQNDSVNIDVQFHREVNEVLLKYAPQYETLFEKRKEIVTAIREPTDEECDWPSDAEEDGDNDSDVPAVLTNVVEDTLGAQPTNVTSPVPTTDAVPALKGVPNFWLTCFKNEGTIFEMIEPHDEPILACLQDVKVVMHGDEGFSLEFIFEPNEFFNDTVLTKRYDMRYETDPDDPLQYDGPEIVSCTGCKINWKNGKDVTKKHVEKKQKHKGTGITRTVTKQVDGESFFNFFNPPAIQDHTEGSELDLDTDTEMALVMDYEVGLLLRKFVIPRAILYFTGEAVTEDDSDDEFDSDDDDDEAEEEEGEGNPPGRIQMTNVGGISVMVEDP